MKNFFGLCFLASFLFALLLVGCSQERPSAALPQQNPVRVKWTVAFPNSTALANLTLSGGPQTQVAPVAVALRLRSTDGKVQERTLEPGQASAEFTVFPGKIEVSARYVVGMVVSGSKDPAREAGSAEENLVAVRKKACENPTEVAYLLAQGSQTQVVEQNTDTLTLTLGALTPLPLVPGGVLFQAKSSKGVAAVSNVRLFPLDPEWENPLPSACAGRSLGEATTNSAGVAPLRMPLFSKREGSLEFRFVTLGGSGQVKIPVPSVTSFGKNLHRITVDEGVSGIAQVQAASDPVQEFGPAFFAELAGPVEASRICRGTILLGVAGTALCDVSPAPKSCSLDGETNCLASAGFPAVSASLLTPGNLKKDVTVAGVTGEYPSAAFPLVGADATADLTTLEANTAAGAYEFFDSAGTRRTGVISDAGAIAIGTSLQVFNTSLYRQFTVPGDAELLATNLANGVEIFGVTGTAPLSPAVCSAEGASACVVDTATPFRAVNTTGLASKVLSGQVVAGVAGNVTLPGSSDVRSSASYGVGGTGTTGSLSDCVFDGATGCVSTVGFPAVNLTLMAPSVIKKNVTLAGVMGDYPSSSFPLTGASGTPDLTSLAATTAAGSYEFFDSAGARFLGSIADAGAISIGQASQTFGTSLYRQFTVPGDADLVAANILGGVNLFGVTGNLVAPSACTADGQSNCAIPPSGSFKAADTSNFNGWDLRKKRNPTTGAVLTFAGLLGQSKTCRNSVNLAVFDNMMSPAFAGLDFFDTIDDANNNLLGRPSQVPAWTVINSTNYGADFFCGGIYATGDTATGNAGADASLAHDANGNWQDLTPGLLPGGANSTNTANGCNATDKHCVFRELISGLMVTEVSAATHTWANAITYCHNLGDAGGAVTNPIPVIGGASYTDWRLPTQKELLQIYNAGVRGLNQTSSLTTFFGNVATSFWSASSVSTQNSDAWTVYLNNGSSYNDTKTNPISKVVCVR